MALAGALGYVFKQDPVQMIDGGRHRVAVRLAALTWVQDVVGGSKPTAGAMPDDD